MKKISYILTVFHIFKSTLFKMHNNYFEAILQLRPKKEILLEFVKAEAFKSNTNIAKEITEKFGYDLYLSSRKSTIQIAKKLKKKFGGEIKVSKTLYSRDRTTSKLIYRLTILFKLK